MVNPAAFTDIILRTTSVYFFLLVGLRLAGKREIGQMTLFDLIVILVISNAVQNAMVGPDTSLTGGLVSAATLLTINFVVSWLRYRFKFIRYWVEGAPTLLIEDGAFLKENMQREYLAEDELLMAMREHGVDRLDQVAKAMLEVDGSISIVPKEGVPIKRKRRVRFLKAGG